MPLDLGVVIIAPVMFLKMSTLIVVVCLWRENFYGCS